MMHHFWKEVELEEFCYVVSSEDRWEIGVVVEHAPEARLHRVGEFGNLTWEVECWWLDRIVRIMGGPQP